MAHERDSIGRIRGASFPLARRGYDQREVDRFMAQIADWLEAGGGDQARADVIRRELERVGERAAAILTGAHDLAEELRLESDREARELLERTRADTERDRREADEYAAETRRQADVHSERTRTDADTYDAETREEADEYAERTRRAATVAAAELREQAETATERAQEEADAAVVETRLGAEHDAGQKIAAAHNDADAIVEEAHRRRDELELVIADLEQRRDAVIAEMRRLSSDLAGSATGDPQASQEADDDVGEGEDDDPDAAQSEVTTRAHRVGAGDAS